MSNKLSVFSVNNFMCWLFCLTSLHSSLQRPPEADTSSELAKKSKEVFRKEVSFKILLGFLPNNYSDSSCVSNSSNFSISPAYLFRCHSLLCTALIRTASQTANWAVSVTQKTSNILLER